MRHLVPQLRRRNRWRRSPRVNASSRERLVAPQWPR
jgi:hypothetical protein